MGPNMTDPDLRVKLATLGELDADARSAFDAVETAPAGAVLRLGERVFAAYEDKGGDIVSRVLNGDEWGPRVAVTRAAPRRQGERWDQPRLILGPDDAVWVAYRSEKRRRVFCHRWLGEAWGPRIHGPAIHHVCPASNAQFDEELRPVAEFIIEGARVRNAVEARLTSSDDPAVTRVESMPIPALKAAPGKGVLFVDTQDVDEAIGLQWRAETAVKRPSNPVLSPPQDPGAPDALRLFNRGTVHVEDGLFRMWYGCADLDSPEAPDRQGADWQKRMHVCYAESNDGIAWRRPVLGLVDYRGSRHNNCLPVLFRVPAICHDELEPDPERRYKCVEAATIENSWHPQSGDLLTSADGIHWRREPAPRRFPGTRPWYIEHHCLFRDDFELDPERRWKAYGSFAAGPSRRTSHLSTSPDCKHWTGYPENPIIDPLQGVGHCIHDLIVWPECGKYVGLLQVGDELHNYQWELVVSRDAVHFSRVTDGLKFLGSGGPGEWDSGSVQASSPVRVDDEWWFYYGGIERPWSSYPATPEELWRHKMSCGVATIGVGRYAAFAPRAGGSQGRLTTRPITCDFDRELGLVANAVADQHSVISVAVLDALSRAPLPGFSFDECRPVAADGVATPVQWSGSPLRLLRKQPIRVCFQLDGARAKLYGFEWRSPR